MRRMYAVLRRSKRWGQAVNSHAPESCAGWYDEARRLSHGHNDLSMVRTGRRGGPDSFYAPDRGEAGEEKKLFSRIGISVIIKKQTICVRGRNGRLGGPGSVAFAVRGFASRCPLYRREGAVS